MTEKVGPNTKLAAPTVHLNGTSREELERQLIFAGQMLDKAVGALMEASPNARDYYVQRDPAAYTIAVNEHNSRVQRVQSVVDEIASILETVGGLS